MLGASEIAVVVAMMMQTGVDLPPKEVGCMAQNIYHEARGESIDGQLAVAHVTYNRVQSPRFPDNVCDVVVHDKGPAPYDCQFSWTCDGKSDRARDVEAFALAVLLSIEVMTRRAEDLTQGAQFYVAKSALNRRWVRNLEPVGKIGRHFFMRRRS